MRPDRADYYLTALDRGEEPGRWLGGWLGRGAEQLGLSGEVTGPQLRAFLDARHPDTGEQLSRHPARKVPGFDHTFRAPKSVSLLWALSDRDTAAEVVAAHDAVEGSVAAAFRQRTSRTDDPVLHTHVLVGEPAKIVTERLGHSTAAYTQDAGRRFGQCLRRPLVGSDDGSPAADEGRR